MKFQKKSKVEAKIPTASLPDIIFMLLIFFMVTTVLKKYAGLQVTLPAAEKVEKIESRRHIAYLWVSQDGRIAVNDQLVDIKSISGIMYKLRVADPQVLVSLKIDKNAKMEAVTAVHEELRKADALRVNYATTIKAT